MMRRGAVVVLTLTIGIMGLLHPDTARAIGSYPSAPWAIPTTGTVGFTYGTPTGFEGLHTGIDIWTGDGTSSQSSPGNAVYAAYTGNVVKLQDACGDDYPADADPNNPAIPMVPSRVLIQHEYQGRTIWTLYSHMAQYTGDPTKQDACGNPINGASKARSFILVRAGEAVDWTTQIGSQGDCCTQDNPAHITHLHFQVNTAGTPGPGLTGTADPTFYITGNIWGTQTTGAPTPIPPGTTLTYDGASTSPPAICTDQRSNPNVASGPADGNKVLILDSTVDQGCSSLEAQAVLSENLGVDIVNGTQWDAMSSVDFASYRALVLGDPVCVEGTSPIDAANENKSVWGPVLNGNTIIIGTDPVFHSYFGNNSSGAYNVIAQGMAFATGTVGKTGGYLDLSCYYAGAAPNTSVPLLNGVNTLPLPGGGTPTDTNTAFTVQGANCSDSGHIIASDNATPIGLTDADLSSWECSVHEGFDLWPADFRVLALDEESTATYVSPDGTVRGLPYILVRGSGVTAITPLTIVPPAGVSGSGNTTTDPFVVPVDSPSATFTIKVCTLSGGCGSDPPAGNVVTLHVNSAIFTAATDSNGVATFTITPPLGGITAIFATLVDPVTGNTITSDTKFYQFSLASVSDGIPPTTSASAAVGSSPYTFGTWTNQAVQVSLSASDNPDGSGVAATYYAVDNPACTATSTGSCLSYGGSAFTVSGEGIHTITYFSQDNAGNVETPQTATVKIDTTPPSLNISGPANGTIFNICSGVPSRPTFSPTDALSGLDGSQGDSWTTPSTATGVGAYTYSAHAQDLAGNSASETRAYQVQYGTAFGGILPPINTNGAGHFKLGSTIPVKFQLLCNGAPITDAVAMLTLKPSDGTSTPGSDVPVSTAASATGNQFRSDATGGQYIFTLSTKSGYTTPDGSTMAFTPGAWTLSMLLDDETSRSVNIQLAH